MSQMIRDNLTIQMYQSEEEHTITNKLNYHDTVKVDAYPVRKHRAITLLKLDCSTWLLKNTRWKGSLTETWRQQESLVRAASCLHETNSLPVQIVRRRSARCKPASEVRRIFSAQRLHSIWWLRVTMQVYWSSCVDSVVSQWHIAVSVSVTMWQHYLVKPRHLATLCKMKKVRFAVVLACCHCWITDQFFVCDIFQQKDQTMK